MTASDIEKAERHSRSRAALMAAMAAILLTQAVIGFGDGADSVLRPYVRHVGWGVLIILWLVILATGGGLALSKNVRSVMNDEVALAHRGAALQAGFWTAMLAGLAIYSASFAWDFSLREGLRLLLNLSVAAALFRYARLELR